MPYKSPKKKRLNNKQAIRKPTEQLLTEKEKSHAFLEDGKQTREFIHVKDVAKAKLLALERNNADYKAINIGTGKPISIKELAETLTKLYNKPSLQPYISNEYRKGDIRHCYADTTKAQKLLNFKPKISLKDGLTELAGWAKTHDWGAVDLFEKALKDLKERHLA